MAARATRSKEGPAPAVVLARLVLGGVLFYAGFTKFKDVHAFAEEVGNYKLLPAYAEHLVAIALPWIEVVAGAMLVLNLWARTAALVSMLLFTTFAFAVTSAVLRGYDISCGCFGKASAGPVGMKTLAIDAVGLALSLLVFLKTLRK